MVVNLSSAERTLATYEVVVERAFEQVLEASQVWARALLVQLPIRLAVAQESECPYLYDEEVQHEVDARFDEFKDQIPGELVEGLRGSPLLDMDGILARFTALLEPARSVLFAAGYEALADPLPLEDDPELLLMIEAVTAFTISCELRDEARSALEFQEKNPGELELRDEKDPSENPEDELC